MRNKRQNNSKKEISISLFIPLIIIVLCIILFINVSNSNATVIASTNEGISGTVAQNELEIAKTTETEEESSNSSSDNVEENVETTTSDTTENAKTATYTVNGEQYTVVGILDIPSLGIKYPILSETSTQLLKVSLNKYWGTNPNEVGNMVVVGHNYNDNKFFSKLPKIEIGDIVKITDLAGKTLDYKVYDTSVIDPYDNACTSQLTDGHTEITLITCYNNGKDRFVAKARAY